MDSYGNDGFVYGFLDELCGNYIPTPGYAIQNHTTNHMPPMTYGMQPVIKQEVRQEVEQVVQQVVQQDVQHAVQHAIQQDIQHVIKQEAQEVAEQQEMQLANAEESADSNEPELDIIINNVVCSFSVKCHLGLRDIAQAGSNVEFRRENGLVRMRLRKPRVMANIASSGKITCTGATSETDAKIAARRCARSLQKMGYKVRFDNYKIVNVLGTCTMPWAIKLVVFARSYQHVVQYEPEIQPGVIYKIADLKATVRIFSTGSVTVTAPSVGAVQEAIVNVYPILYEFRKERTEEERAALNNQKILEEEEDS